MTNRTTLLKRLDAAQEVVGVGRVREWLSREDSRFISDRVAKVTVSEARRLWGVRLRNTSITGKRLDGAPELLARLAEMPQQAKVEMFALSGPEISGNLFFEGTSHRYVGAILYESREQLKRA
jgi:hypothetical protein